jgi:hypothetical protein
MAQGESKVATALETNGRAVVAGWSAAASEELPGHPQAASTRNSPYRVPRIFITIAPFYLL